MKLVLSNAWWPMCVGKYLLRAARRAGHEVRTIGPSSGDRIDVWEEPLSIAGEGVAPDICADATTTPERLVELDRLALEAAEWCDLWLDVDGGWFIYAPLPARRRVLVATDPHCASWCPRNNYAEQRWFVSEVFVMQSAYARPGEGWLPYAFDPEWFRPDATVPRTGDVTNLGAPYPDRCGISDALAARGLRVLGPGRRCIGDAHRRELCSAPVAIVWPLSDDLPCRVFEALACERTVVSRVNPEIARLGLGGAVVERHTVAEVIDTAALLAHLGGGSEACARRFAELVKPHTWDARLAQLIEGRLEP